MHRIQKGALSATLAGVLTLSIAGNALAVNADVEDAPLFRWDKAAGAYGNTPVPFSPHGDDTQVRIPTEFQSVKQDHRSAWVATVLNLNFPGVCGEEQFVAEYDDILSTLADYNMNSVIFQIRPQQDAWYKSELGNPWSRYLTCENLEGTDPGFDPTEILVQRSHDAGIEFHAWFNPYRVENRAFTSWPAADRDKVTALGYSAKDIELASAEDRVKIFNEAGLLADENFAVQHPEWVFKHGWNLFLNPGIPEVRDHIVATMAEVVENYDVDALHFDDYFYPDGFGSANPDPATAADAADFALYGADFPFTQQGLDDWRRENVNILIRDIRALLDQHNASNGTSVQFGISPAGIWNHKGNVETGSLTPTSSMSTYLRLYADTRGWVKEDLLDYITPQLYWTFGTEVAPFGELARWWSDVAEGTIADVYIGQAIYRQGTEIASAGGDWYNPDETANQLRFVQTLDNVHGVAFYSYAFLPPNSNEVLTGAQNGVKGYWDYTALVPEKQHLSHGVSAPDTLRLEGGTLTWANTDLATSRYFIIYRGSGDAQTVIDNPRNIVGRIWAGTDATRSFDVSNLPVPGEGETYFVTTTNQAGVESGPAAIEYYVTVEPGNGDESTVLTVTGGDTVAEPAAPVREGYKFVGWASSATPGELYDFSSPVESDFTLHAVWEELGSLTVTFHPQNGEQPWTVSVFEGSSVEKPADPVRAGYKFVGWTTDESGKQAYDFASEVEVDTVLYAQWEKDDPTLPTTPGTPGGSLPETGANAPLLFGALGAGIAALGASVLFMRRRRS